MLLRGDTETLTALAVVRRVHRPGTLEHHPVRIATGDLLSGRDGFPPRGEGSRAVQRDLGATVLGDVGRLVGFDPPTHLGSECATELAATRSGGCSGGYRCSRGRGGRGTRGRPATRSGWVVVVEGPVRCADCGDLAIGGTDSLRANLVVGTGELGARVGVDGTVGRNLQSEFTLVTLVRTVDDETVKDGIRRVAGVQMNGDAGLRDVREASAERLDRVGRLREVSTQPLTLGFPGPARAGTGTAGGRAAARARGRASGLATGRTRAGRGAAGAVTAVTREREDDERNDETQGQEAEESHQGVEGPPTAARVVVIAVVVRHGAVVAGARPTRATATTSRLADVLDLDVQAGDDIVGILVGDLATRVVAANRDESDVGILRVVLAALDGRRGRRISLGVCAILVPALVLRRRGRGVVGRLDRHDFSVNQLQQVVLLLLGDQAGGRVVFDADPGLPRVFGVVTPVLRGGNVVPPLVAAGIRPVIVIVIAHVALLGLLRRVRFGIHLGLLVEFGQDLV